MQYNAIQCNTMQYNAPVTQYCCCIFKYTNTCLPYRITLETFSEVKWSYVEVLGDKITMHIRVTLYLA